MTVPLLGGAGLLLLGLHGVGAAFLVLGLFTAFFFRDPERAVPEDSRLILSPADGRVVEVRETVDEAVGSGAVQVSIFLSIFDVHINRAPISGRIAELVYHKGSYLPAFNPRASLQNEQNKVTLVDGEIRLAFKQIAGLIARRIVFRKRVNEAVVRGERVGLIVFGSRVDVLLPKEVRVRVRVGDRVRGGSSVIGERA